MKVIFVCEYDWANMGYTLSKCLNSVDVYCKSFAIRQYHFNYPEQSLSFKENVNKELEEADIVIFIQSKFFKLDVDLSKKIIAVMHTGTTYRQHAEDVNKVFNKVVDVSFCSSDLLRLGAKNEICYQPAIDINSFVPVYSDFENRDNVIIGHYPTHKKGTKKILEAIDRLKHRRPDLNFEFKYDEKNVPFEEHIKRVSECDIYIEDMRPKQGSIPLTAFGITALECACLGKIVCTRFPDLPLYEKLFGKCEIQVTNKPIDLEIKLEQLLSMPKNDLIALQKKTRKWVEERHSFEVIGNWFKKQFERIEEMK
jgi:hypothetical protein